MIRINLLPVKQTAAARRVVVQLVLFAAVIGLFLLAGFGTAYYFADQVTQREDQVTKNDRQIKEYRDIIGEVEKAEKQRARLRAQLQEIERLQRGKLGPVRVLDALSNNIPKRVWITSFKESKGQVTIQGTGLENADISEFMRQLQKNKYFNGVALKFTESTTANGVTIYNFAIAAVVNYTA
jgi:type IV pilus assembly protein PilN